MWDRQNQADRKTIAKNSSYIGKFFFLDQGDQGRSDPSIACP